MILTDNSILWGKTNCILFSFSITQRSMLIIFGSQTRKWICNRTVTKLSTSPNECHYTTLWCTKCVSLFITDIAAQIPVIRSWFLSSLQNYSQLHHQSTCRMTEVRIIMTKKRGIAADCLLRGRPTFSKNVMDSRTTRQHTVRVRPLSCCET